MACHKSLSAPRKQIFSYVFFKSRLLMYINGGRDCTPLFNKLIVNAWIPSLCVVNSYTSENGNDLPTNFSCFKKNGWMSHKSLQSFPFLSTPALLFVCDLLDNFTFSSLLLLCEQHSTETVAKKIHTAHWVLWSWYVGIVKLCSPPKSHRCWCSMIMAWLYETSVGSGSCNNMTKQ